MQTDNEFILQRHAGDHGEHSFAVADYCEEQHRIEAKVRFPIRAVTEVDHAARADVVARILLDVRDKETAITACRGGELIQFDLECAGSGGNLLFRNLDRVILTMRPGRFPSAVCPLEKCIHLVCSLLWFSGLFLL